MAFRLYLFTSVAEPEVTYAPLLLWLLFQEETATDVALKVVGSLLVPLPLSNRANARLDISQLLQNLSVAFDDVLLLIFPYNHVEGATHGEWAPNHNNILIIWPSRLHIHRCKIRITVLLSNCLLVDLVPRSVSDLGTAHLTIGLNINKATLR